MRPSKIGPWKMDDWESFVELDCELQEPTAPNQITNWLYRTGRSKLGPSDEAVEAELEKWSQHPVLKTVAGDPDFNSAVKLFGRKHGSARHGNLARSNSPLVFLQMFVRYAGLLYLTKSRPKKAKRWARRRKSAAKYASRLLELLRAEVSLDDVSENIRLTALLKKLTDELAVPRRKSRASDESEIMQGFIYVVGLRCGLVSPTIAQRLADMVHVDLGTRQIERYCQETRQLVRERNLDLFAEEPAQR